MTINNVLLMRKKERIIININKEYYRYICNLNQNYFKCTVVSYNGLLTNLVLNVMQFSNVL